VLTGTFTQIPEPSSAIAFPTVDWLDPLHTGKPHQSCETRIRLTLPKLGIGAQLVAEARANEITRILRKFVKPNVRDFSNSYDGSSGRFY
jgi:hypothetical protein